MGECGADQQSAVRSTGDRQPLAARSPGGDEPVGGGVEVVEDGVDLPQHVVGRNEAVDVEGVEEIAGVEFLLVTKHRNRP